MSNIVRHLITSIILASYCYAIALSGIVPQNPYFTGGSTSGKDSYYQAVATNLCCQARRSESSGNEYSFTIYSFPGHPSDEFKLYNKANNLLIRNEYSQYALIWENFPIKYRKANIFFPFNYFW